MRFPRVSLFFAGSVLLAACGGGGADDRARAGATNVHGDGGSVFDPNHTGFPTDDCDGFVLDEGEFTVQPGADINYCMRLPMPPEWQAKGDQGMWGFSWDLAATHHFFMEYSPHPFPGPGQDAVPCSEYAWNTATGVYDHVPGASPEGTFSFIGSANSEDSKFIFGAGEGSDYLVTDGRHGRYMVANGHFRTSHHLINLTDEPITTRAKFKVCAKPAGEFQNLLTGLTCTTTAIDVPEGQTGSVRATCTAPFDMDIVVLASHAHAHLTSFQMQVYDGQRTLPDVIYESTNWDSPEIRYLDEPIHLKAGMGITYTCNYLGPAQFRDATDVPQAEHCAAFLSYSYPDARPGVIPPQLTGLATAPDAVSAAFDSLGVSPI